MDLHMVCLRCFQYKGDYGVCPYCGYEEDTPPPEPYQLHPGGVLKDRYIIGTVLGYGGFGVTYKAYDIMLGIAVAVKEFYPGGLVSRIPGQTMISVFPGAGEQSFHAQKARFMEEARSLARFNGEVYIVNVYDYFEMNHTAYIVMEFLEGQTLKEYLGVVGGRVPLEDALRMMRSVLEGLSLIHGRGIIHRDISPDNVFLLHSGQVKILDFGAARLPDARETSGVRAPQIKVGYAPPEQYRASAEHGPPTDLYAAGATLYKLLTGKTPDESIDRLERDTLKRPSRVGGPVDGRIEKVILKAMELDPKNRFQTSEEMLAALESKGKRASWWG